MNEHSQYAPQQTLERLVGFRLYAVEFVVNDYVQFRLDGETDVSESLTLNCYVWPQVEYAGRLWREADLGYADALRKLTPGTVTATSQRAAAGLGITLDTGALFINPAREEVHVEIAELMGFADGTWAVWAPGDAGFEHLAR
ncbi:hypothetical protein JT358_06020 [Micrococcales bacterium 31B]|nr:hypothetical protein [Micrococcales bacterium 31B]